MQSKRPRNIYTEYTSDGFEDILKYSQTYLSYYVQKKKRNSQSIPRKVSYLNMNKIQLDLAAKKSILHCLWESFIVIVQQSRDGFHLDQKTFDLSTTINLLQSSDEIHNIALTIRIS